MGKSKDKVEEKVVEETPAPTETPLTPFSEKFQRKINSGFVAGRLAANPELKYLENGRAYTRLRICNPQDYYQGNGDAEERKLVKHTSTFPVVFFGPIAENAAIPNKGDLVGILYTLDQQSWLNNFGEARSYLRLVGRQIDFYSSPQNRTTEAEEILPTDAELGVGPPEDDMPF
ncbi:MAG: single-stranded DNA-binding protein [Pseudomonadota bacterium]